MDAVARCRRGATLNLTTALATSERRPRASIVCHAGVCHAGACYKYLPPMGSLASPRRRAANWWSFLALMCAVIGACTRTAERPDVLVVVLDTARPDYLSAYGWPRPTTPFLESLAARGTRFDRAYSSSSWTLPAHASLFTGTPPRVHGADQASLSVSEELPLLVEDLRAAGYRTAGFSGNKWIGPATGLSRGFEHFEELATDIYVPHIERLSTDRAGQPAPSELHYVVSRVRGWLEANVADERPLFLFVNLVEPHLPYLPDVESLRPFDPDPDARWEAIEHFYPKGNTRGVYDRHYDRKRHLSSDEWADLRAMYEGALRLADRLAERIVADVEALVGPDTIVIVLSDHGENFGDHGHFTHMFNLYDSNLRIALIARGRGFEPGRVERGVVQIADVHATILAAAGLAARARPDTIDLRAPVHGERVITGELDYPEVSLKTFTKARTMGRMAPYERSLLTAVGQRFKLIRGSDGSEELYDIVADPDERVPLRRDAIPPAEMAQLEGALQRLMEKLPATRSERGQALKTPEGQRELRAMGYAGGEDDDG